MTTPPRKYKWVTINSKTSDDLERDCKEKYPGHIIVKRSIIKTDYKKDIPYKQMFILVKVRSKD